MTKAALLLTVLLAAASLWIFARDNYRIQHAAAYAAVSAIDHSGVASQSAAQNGQTRAPDQKPAVTPTTERSAAIEQSNAERDGSADRSSNRQLPQTSTILPLLGLIGLGSLVAGLFARR